MTEDLVFFLFVYVSCLHILLFTCCKLTGTKNGSKRTNQLLRVLQPMTWRLDNIDTWVHANKVIYYYSRCLFLSLSLSVSVSLSLSLCLCLCICLFVSVSLSPSLSLPLSLRHVPQNVVLQRPRNTQRVGEFRYHDSVIEGAIKNQEAWSLPHKRLFLNRNCSGRHSFIIQTLDHSLLPSCNVFKDKKKRKNISFRFVLRWLLGVKCLYLIKLTYLLPAFNLLKQLLLLNTCVW